MDLEYLSFRESLSGRQEKGEARDRIYGDRDLTIELEIGARDNVTVRST
jgi:hypothetical protein